jgi:nucleoside-diphosphate-sugar epimerase
MAETDPDRATGPVPGQRVPGRRRLPAPRDCRDPRDARQSKSILVLGAGDLLARRVTRALVTSGHTVTVAGYRNDAHDSPGAPRRFIRLEDADALGSAVASHDAVINLEPVISEPRSPLQALLDRPARRRRARQLTTLTRALDGAPASRWIQRSTPALYLDGGDLWLNEDSPTSVNRATEHANSAEQAVREHVRRGGSGLVLRLARPYGPDDHWTHEILRLARKGWQPFDGPDSAFVPTISLSDATSAVLAALDAAPGIYNVADPVPSTNRQLNDLAAAVTGQETLHPLYPSYSAADRDLLRRSCRLDVTVFRTATGWNPQPAPFALAFIPSA